MSGPAADPRAPARPLPAPARAVAVAAASFVLGGLTFFAQGFLPEAVSSFANSASGWTLLTVLLIHAARLNTAASAVLGAVGFVLLVLGYSAAAHLQGLFYSPVLFGAVGAVVGPFVGTATAWLRSRSRPRAAAGTALLSGIGIGEGVYGLTYIADTTSPVYWIAVAAAGTALLAAMTATRLRGAGALPIATALAATAAVAGLFVVAYVALGSVG
ncbi:DUF6518 family protein [Streptomonospora sp. S1-112]|uniref:DUF6518 family protein n=1 Tax=Streptomonospora mangrovi TaxID=2883123 RepID=A0A9X3SH52_9ACTN|nr:DUF6518 family protein [Streptomonospora mangrovi]MDA0566700.1 DUF6518 family protein [Streptomonospora mangrovi]